MPRMYQLVTHENGCSVQSVSGNVLFEHSNCFNCPLPKCLLDYTGPSERSKTLSRYRAWADMIELANSPRKNRTNLAEEIAVKNNVGVRTVWRWLKEFHFADGNKTKFLRGSKHGTST